MSHPLDVEAVERDLSFLAHRKGGFEKPESLMDGLEVVLSLQAVEQVAGTMQGSRAARVAAFQRVLRQALDRISRDSTRLAAGIYFFLLTKDELKERQLSPTLIQAPLGERRKAIAELLNTTPGGFRNGTEQRICALAAGELLCYETELIRISKDPEPSPIGTAEDSLAAMTVRSATQAVSRTISHLYRKDHQLHPLASLLIPDRAIYYDAAVLLVLTDDAVAATHYNYRLSLTFTAELQEYVVGYVSQSHLTEALLVGTHLITDIYSFSTDEDRDACYARLCDSLDVVTLITTLADGRTRHQPARMEAIAEEEYPNYLGTEYELHKDAIKLLRVKLPETAAAVRLRVIQDFNVSKSDHFCYWVADRPIYLRQLRVDARDFNPPDSARDRRVTLQPFMMATSADIALGHDGTADIETNTWLIRGQGFAVIW